MKTPVLCLLFLAILTSYAQTEVDTQWSTEINNVFQNIEKNRIPHGILLDYAMEFTDIPSYKGNLTDSTYIDVGVLSNIYKTLYMGQVTTDTTHFPQLKNYAKAWLEERRSQNLGNTKTLTIGGLYYQYSQIKETALNDNEINVNPLSRRYSDKYINGVWQNPYKTSQTIAFAPPVSTMDQQNFQVVIPNNLFLSNAQGNILSIQIDFEDGLGYRTVNFDNPVSVNYRRNGIYTWTFRILKTGRETLYTQSKIRIEAQSDGLSSSRTINNTVEIGGPGYGGGAILSIDYAPGNGTTLTKPLIIAEGFDPGNVLAPESLTGINNLGDFSNSLLSAGSNLQNLINPINTSRQYDIVYVDWKNGTAAIQDNSVTLKNVITYINTEKVGNEPNVLLGQSMGGVIGRYTLATMENDNIDHDVRLFISHDAPMQGSNTPIGIQHFTRHTLNAFTSIPILQGLDITLSLAADIIDIWESTTAMDINAGFIDPYISPTDVLTIQDTPAAVQLNYHWVTPGEQAITVLHNQWQNHFDLIGYPQDSRNIAISNGNECAADHGFVAGDELIDILDLDNPDFWGDLLSLVAVPAGGVLLFDPGLIGLGLIPGSSEWKFDFDIYSTPDVFNFNKEVYRGRVQYTKKILWLFPVTHNLTSRDKDAPSGFFPYGSFTGGQLPGGISGILDDVPLPLSVDIVNNNYGFIPTASSLDVRRNNGYLPLIDDHKRKYGGGNIDYPGLNSEFDNFIVDYNISGAQINNEHLSFQPRNGNWLAEELNASPNGSVFDCRILCNDQSIQGEDALCSSGLYFIDISPIGVTTIWSLSNTSAATITSSSSTDVTIQAVPNQLATVILTAIINIPDCGGFRTLTKDIRIGRPETPTSLDGPEVVEIGATTSYDAGPSEGSSGYEWDLPGFHQNVTTFDQNSNNWQLRSPWNTDIALVFTGQGEIEGDVRVRGINDCGTSPYRGISVTVERGGAGGIERISEDVQVLTYPNPASNIINITLNDTFGTDKATEIQKITVFDNTMLQQPVSDFGDGITYGELDVSVLKTGIYFIEVVTNKGTEIKKLIID